MWYAQADEILVTTSMGAHACTYVQAVTHAQMATHEGLCFLPTVLGWAVESVKHGPTCQPTQHGVEGALMTLPTPH